MRRLFLLLSMAVASLQVAVAQKGWQIHGGAGGGLTYIASQNHYDNSNYQLKYKSSLGYCGSAGLGYGFNSRMGVLLEAGILQINQKYGNKFSPGLGFVGPGEHQKTVNLTYYSIAPQARFSTNFVDDYVLDAKLQGYVQTGFQLSFLGKANSSYELDGNIEPYPSKLRPYSAAGYPYNPVENDNELFTKLALAFTVQVGLEYFIADKFSVNAALRGHASLTDINNKTFRVHEGYKGSRYFFGGLYLGLGYYINRG